MAQDNTFLSGVDDVNTAQEQDRREFEAYMDDDLLPDAASKDIKPATDEDIDAAKKGEKPTDAAEIARKAAEAKAKQEEEHRKFIEGEDPENEDEDEETDPKAKEAPKDKKEEKPEEPILGDVESFATDLFKTGILTRDEYDEDGLPSTQEELVERLTWEKQKGAEYMVSEFFSKHGPEWEKALQAIAVDGVHPLEYIKQFAEIQSFKDMDMADEDNQERVIKAALQKQGLDDEAIRNKIKRLKTNEDLEAEAIEYHKALIKTEEQDLLRSQQEAKVKVEQKKRAEAQYSATVRETYSEALKKGELDGIPVSKEIADKAISFLEKPKWKLGDQLLTDMEVLFMELKHPHNAATAFKLASLIKEINPGKAIELNVKPIGKKAISKESESIFQSIPSRKEKNKPVSETNKTSRFLEGL